MITFIDNHHAACQLEPIRRALPSDPFTYDNHAARRPDPLGLLIRAKGERRQILGILVSLSCSLSQITSELGASKSRGGVMVMQSLVRLMFGAALLSHCALPAHAADVTLRIEGTNGETASVFLDTDAGTWAGTNGGTGDLLKARSGRYKAGTNVVPGFAVKGTGLLVGKNGNEVEAFFYNLIPNESSVGATDRAHLLGTGNTGKWTVR